MVDLIEIDDVFYELVERMKNDWNGTPEQRYELAKKEILEDIEFIIKQCKTDAINRYNEEKKN